ncbi:unnamed protein product [Rotaria magnacalcarata]|uniref:EGF-like domain-containing protein n=1 Tax=Rotaria magnacalcarata TaxID=392030 RepID=A0A816RIN8_9BILA|nr:unnamed protein product [Rotaria magnacalcarata]
MVPHSFHNTKDQLHISIVLDTCTLGNGACDPNAGCSHDNKTNAVVCTCTTGYTNTGVAPNVVCTGTMTASTKSGTFLAFPCFQTPAPSAMEVALQTPPAHMTTQRML